MVTKARQLAELSNDVSSNNIQEMQKGISTLTTSETALQGAVQALSIAVARLQADVTKLKVQVGSK